MALVALDTRDEKTSAFYNPFNVATILRVVISLAYSVRILIIPVGPTGLIYSLAAVRKCHYYCVKFERFFDDGNGFLKSSRCVSWHPVGMVFYA